jgi:hypothetical protein
MADILDIIPSRNDFVIGSEANPVRKIVVDEIVVTGQVKNNAVYTVTPEVQVDSGIKLDSNNKVVIYNGISSVVTFENTVTVSGANIEMSNGNIDMGTTNYMNDTGADSRGLTFSSTGKGKFLNGLSVTGNLDLEGSTSNIAMGTSNYMSDTGADSRGLYFTSAGACNFLNGVGVTGDIAATGEISAGLGSSLLAGHLRITDGISAPSTTAGEAKLYVDSADGDFKIKFGDGSVGVVNLTF